ncbi:ATP-binding protein [Veillonella caviae]|uniref:ATP-binding protein n=1 Tax=Veillonella caviae TaxID=248316 RepID=UPI0023A8DD21|nr:ATP-binding protein [Veillonella caviae]MCI5707987.1 ATP-binding protein [Veillonella caviae]
MKIITGKRKRAQKCIVYGPEGIGKTTFASQFPNPVFIDTEGSTDHLDVARTDKPTSWTMLIAYIKEFINMPGGYQTLVIDTIDWAEQLCVEHICAKHHKQGIEDFGYGTGYVYVREEMGRFLNLLDEVIAAGMHVVMTAHAQIRKFEQPDELGAYDRFELKLGKKTGSQTSPLIKEWADMVLFANYKNEIITTSDTKKKKATGGKRVMYASHSPAWDAKNRHGLPDMMPFDYTQIAHVIPTDVIGETLINELPQNQSEEVKTAVLEETGVITPMAPQNEHTEPPINKKEESQTEDIPIVETKIPKPLKDLMVKDSITLDQLQNVIVERGKYPAGTPFENYDPAFIQGWVIPNWEHIVKFVQAKEGK